MTVIIVRDEYGKEISMFVDDGRPVTMFVRKGGTIVVRHSPTSERLKQLLRTLMP